MIGGFDFTVSNAPVAGIFSLCIIIVITSAEDLIIFVLDISNVFQNIILPHPIEIVYPSLPHIYLDWCKRKWPKHPFASRNKKEPCIKSINSIQSKNFWKFCYELLKPIFITVKMIISSSDHAVFSWVYKNYKSFLAVETYEILISTDNRTLFERLT